MYNVNLCNSKSKFNFNEITDKKNILNLLPFGLKNLLLIPNYYQFI